MKDIIISTNNLSKRYGKFLAVKSLNLDIYQGEIYGLLGPNGAGKSTTILMLLGLTEATSGTICVAGVDPQRDPVEVKKIVGYLPDNVGFYDHMSGLDNLIFIAELNGLSRNQALQRSNDLLEKVGLLAVKGNKVSTYSRGMRQRLGLAEVLIKNPKVIILDEPTLGLDPIGVQEFLHLIKDLKENDGLTVLLSSHHLNHVQQICDRIGLFSEGELRISGNLAELSENLDDKNSDYYELELENLDELGRSNVVKLLKDAHQSIDISVDGNLLEIKGIGISIDLLVSALKEHDRSISRIEKKKKSIDDIYSYYLNQN